jgi:hypothetical protein
MRLWDGLAAGWRSSGTSLRERHGLLNPTSSRRADSHARLSFMHSPGARSPRYKRLRLGTTETPALAGK